MPETRWRITYTVKGPLRYISHLEQVRVWERAIRRAGLPLAYSGGFTPRPRLQVAAPLPLGFASEAEWLDLWLEQPVEPETIVQALTSTLPEGLAIRSIEEVPLSAPSLPSQVAAAEYEVAVETAVPAEEIRRRIEELLAAETLPRERRGRPYNLRPLILSLRLEEVRAGEGVLTMLLSAREGATGRPEEVLDALGLADGFFRVTRRRIHLTASTAPARQTVESSLSPESSG
ncbi:MAG: TIGR03936 family radical SAM-associated protein [Anaerolineae bacterium]|nr:TIGR03936 family radical SAM-associated protein [Anaerolineae bacterium]